MLVSQVRLAVFVLGVHILTSRGGIWPDGLMMEPLCPSIDGLLCGQTCFDVDPDNNVNGLCKFLSRRCI